MPPNQRLLRHLRAQERQRSGELGPLHAAIVADDAPALLDCLQSPGALNSLCGGVHRPLTLASLLGNAPIAQLLLDQGAAPELTDVLGNTALHWAVLTRMQSLADSLISAGASMEQKNALDGSPHDYARALTRPLSLRTDEALLRGLHGLPSHAPTPFLAECREASKITTSFVRQLAALLRPTLALPTKYLPVYSPPPGPQLVVADYGTPWGNGLYPCAPLPRGTYVGSYTGVFLSREAALAQQASSHPSRYLTGCDLTNGRSGASNSLYLDARSPYCNLTSLINGCRSQEAANLEPRDHFRGGLPVVDFFTTKDIPAGAQLLWEYGSRYWKRVRYEPWPPPLKTALNPLLAPRNRVGRELT